jgi:hypothetical protein
MQLVNGEIPPVACESIQRPEFILSPLAAAGTLPSFYFHKRLAQLETQLVLAVTSAIALQL